MPFTARVHIATALKDSGATLPRLNGMASTGGRYGIQLNCRGLLRWCCNRTRIKNNDYAKQQQRTAEFRGSSHARVVALLSKKNTLIVCTEILFLFQRIVVLPLIGVCYDRDSHGTDAFIGHPG